MLSVSFVKNRISSVRIMTKRTMTIHNYYYVQLISYKENVLALNCYQVHALFLHCFLKAWIICFDCVCKGKFLHNVFLRFLVLFVGGASKHSKLVIRILGLHLLFILLSKYVLCVQFLFQMLTSQFFCNLICVISAFVKIFKCNDNWPFWERFVALNKKNIQLNTRDYWEVYCQVLFFLLL